MDVSSKPKLQTESTISIAYISDVGSVRKNNEDNFIVTDLTSEKNFDAEEELIARPVGDLGWLLAVSDGMGGAQAGEVASQMATQILAEQLIAALTMSNPKNCWAST